MSGILAKLKLTSVQLKKEEEAERQKRWEEREAQKIIRKAFKQKQQEDLTNFKEMLEKASRWHKLLTCAIT